MGTFLDDVQPIDWTDLEKASVITQALAHRLANDRATLGQLVNGVESDPRLFAKCEKLKPDSKLVIYDAIEDRGFIVRVHLSHLHNHEVPHNHRFSFTAMILNGAYYHTLYAADREVRVEEDVPAIRPVFVRTETVGRSYTMHHEVIEANIPAPDTMIILIRGPKEKDAALVTDRATNGLWWKLGAKDEPESVKEAHRMTVEHYRECKAALRAARVI